MLVFPPEIKRVWIDVGVHTQSDFLPQLAHHTDLFLLGFEPALAHYTPCTHERCVVFWAACTSTDRPQLVELRIQKCGVCNSLLAPNSNTTAAIPRGMGCCVRASKDKDGNSLTHQVPGIPLYVLLSRIPKNIEVEYLKIDAQGYDLEVMKGALLPSSSSSLSSSFVNLPHVASLEAMNVKDKAQLMYHGQPTLDEMIEFLQLKGWTYVNHTVNNALIGEVNAFFASNQSLVDKVGSVISLLK
jgi:hypothetical protein